jgi:hypothetical protein
VFCADVVEVILSGGFEVVLMVILWTVVAVGRTGLNGGEKNSTSRAFDEIFIVTERGQWVKRLDRACTVLPYTMLSEGKYLSSVEDQI